MSLFCLLCIPLFYFLRRTIFPREWHSIWALPLGGIMVLVQYLAGSLLTPNGLGFSRWMGGFVDIVSLPALVPLMVCLLCVMLKIFPPALNYADFTLLWLIPLAVIHSVNGGASPSPIPLILVPLLWIAQGAGIPFFINCMVRNPRWYVIIPAAFAIAALPVAATTSWWAFFCQRSFFGLLLLLLSLIPTAVTFIQSGEQLTINK